MRANGLHIHHDIYKYRVDSAAATRRRHVGDIGMYPYRYKGAIALLLLLMGELIYT